MSMVDYNRQSSRVRILRGDIPYWVKNSKRASYIASVIVSTPPWVSNKELQALRAQAAHLTRTTGVLHELDHIIPLNHPRVCGLTVPWNLCISTRKLNGAKSNHWCPEQEELFESQDEQLEMRMQLIARTLDALPFDNPTKPDTIQTHEEVFDAGAGASVSYPSNIDLFDCVRTADVD